VYAKSAPGALPSFGAHRSANSTDPTRSRRNSIAPSSSLSLSRANKSFIAPFSSSEFPSIVMTLV
jgi:hypothetical protein